MACQRSRKCPHWCQRIAAPGNTTRPERRAEPHGERREEHGKERNAALVEQCRKQNTGQRGCHRAEIPDRGLSSKRGGDRRTCRKTRRQPRYGKRRVERRRR